MIQNWFILKLRANNYRKPDNQVSSNGGNVIRAAAGELCLRYRHSCFGYPRVADHHAP